MNGINDLIGNAEAKINEMEDRALEKTQMKHTK